MPFVKGQRANPYGRPKGTKDMYTIRAFKCALAKVEKEQKISFFEEVIKTALTDKKVMIAVLRKLIPDMATMDHTFPEDLLDDFISIVPTNGKKMPENLARFVN